VREGGRRVRIPDDATRGPPGSWTADVVCLYVPGYAGRSKEPCRFRTMEIRLGMECAGVGLVLLLAEEAPRVEGVEM